jgi:type IV pilus assembly protein PilM
MKKLPSMRSLLYSGDLLAVDLGTFAVKVLHLKAAERSLTVLGSSRREVWAALADAKSEDERNQIYLRTLSELLGEGRFKARSASISLAGNVVILRFLALPAGFKPDAATGLPAEARSSIPFDESDAAVSTLHLGGEMMLAAARNDTVQNGMDIARKAGLRPAVVINDVLALANAYEFFRDKKTQETVALVSVGAASSGVSVVENGEPKAARVFNIAGNAFTRAVRRELNVGLEEAEKLKIENGLSLDVAVARALKPVVKDLASEIMRTIDVLLARRPADYPPVRRLVLAGGSAELKGLRELLAAETGLSVEVFRPIVNTASKDGAPGIAPLASASAVACGLGLSNALAARSPKPRINLAPANARRAATGRDAAASLARLLAVPALVVLALAFFGFWAAKVAREEAATAQKLAAAAKAERDLERKFAKKKLVAVVGKRPADPFAFLARLSVSGVLGQGSSSLVMLAGGYIARGGKLYDGNEAEVRGVTAMTRGNSLALTAGGRLYSIELPK